MTFGNSRPLRRNAAMLIVSGLLVAIPDAPATAGYCGYYTDPSQRQGFWDVCQ